jgi:GAF domain
VEPVPETVIAFRDLERFGETQFAAELFRIGEQVREVVPETMGVSLGIPADRFTFTLVASDEVARTMDAAQYVVDDGPCLSAVHHGETIQTSTRDLLDEGRWQLFARALAAGGVESSLSLPIIHDGRVVAGVNLYASTPEAFDGHHEELAALCGAWPPGIVTNADLSFSTLLTAVQTPQRISEQNTVDQATGMLAAAERLSTQAAGDRIREAAARAAITEAQAAHVVISALTKL